jgi:hypothetical protein
MVNQKYGKPEEVTAIEILTDTFITSTSDSGRPDGIIRIRSSLIKMIANSTVKQSVSQVPLYY